MDLFTAPQCVHTTVSIHLTENKGQGAQLIKDQLIYYVMFMRVDKGPHAQGDERILYTAEPYNSQQTTLRSRQQSNTRQSSHRFFYYCMIDNDIYTQIRNYDNSLS